MCFYCSYLNTEVVKKARLCKIDVDFQKLGIYYESAKTEVREVGTVTLADFSFGLVFRSV